MSSQIFLGPFEVLEPIGKGGMGRVFRAVHGMTGVPVAVKVLSGQKTGLSRQFFQREIQAHARLIHPGVAYVLDYGIVHPLTAEASGGELIAESPYIVMELADEGTLLEKLPLRDWKSVKDVLFQVLDALAFSQARGVIHRDLKPENLLLFSGEEQPWKIKITDYGVAHAIVENEESHNDSLSAFSGTCLYMPPEQINSDWRQYRPWTDLYAVGCIAWQLVCGRPPFEGDSWIQIAMKHGSDERPKLTPCFEIPVGLESWIHRSASITMPMRGH